VTATTVRNNRDHLTLGDGRTVVEAGDGAKLGAWAVDWSILLAASVLTYFILTDHNHVAAIIAALSVWPVGALLYGFACTSRRTIGQAAVGIRTVSLSDGKMPGFWGSGFEMVSRTVVLPVFLAFLVLASVEGDSSGPSGSGSASKDRYLTIDDRASASP
jgi:hypothetical protein